MVVSESSKSRPDVRVRDWLRALAPEQQYVSALSLGEIAYGVERLPQGANKQRLQGWSRALRPFFANRILAADLAVADRWSAQRVVIGRSVSVIDSLIAATAQAHDLIVATRNERDFLDLGVRVINPWSA